jgi:riboflavin synthase
MFTGLVEAVGTVERVDETDAGRELSISGPWTDLALGESIAVNGACLTVRSVDGQRFTAAAMTATLGRTTIGSWKGGTKVNLERSLKLGDRLGGHLVQGHVDAVGTVRRVVRDGSALLVDIAVPSEVERLLVPHGSITVDGVSLTVNALPGPGVLQVSLIEYTERHTTLGILEPGHRVHLESDIIGKYVDGLLKR